MKVRIPNDGSDLGENSPILGSDEESCSAGIPARWMLAILGFFGFFNVYSMRVNLSVAMVAMVHKPHPPKLADQSDYSGIACMELLPNIRSNGSLDSVVPPSLKGEFNWSSNEQALILGSFFYGYVITQIPGGIIAEKYGAKWLFGIGILVTAVFTLLTPLAARWSVWALVAVRAIEGLGEGVTYPAMNTMIGRWVPKLERSRLATFIYVGSPIGTVVSLAVSGFLCDTLTFGGWPSVFYLFGILGCIWFIFWALFAYESPSHHPRISKAELTYIRQGQDEAQTVNTNIPWRAILTSVPVWALVITHFGQNWGFYTLLTEMPTYLSNILHFNIKKNGLLSALPYVLQAIVANLSGILADKFRSNGYSITRIRKISNTIGFYGPGICILIIPFVGCKPVTIMALLCVSVGLNGFVFSGFNVSHVDMSPEFAGTLMGITNCIANMNGFLAPAFVGWAVENGQTLQNWGFVFVTTSTVYFLTGAIFNIFGTADRQFWSQDQRVESAPLNHFRRTS